MFSLQPYFLGHVNVPLQLSCWNYLALAWFQQSTLAACVHVLLMCVCFISSWTHTIRCKTLLMIRDFD